MRRKKRGIDKENQKRKKQYVYLHVNTVMHAINYRFHDKYIVYVNKVDTDPIINGNQ